MVHPNMAHYADIETHPRGFINVFEIHLDLNNGFIVFASYASVVIYTLPINAVHRKKNRNTVCKANAQGAIQKQGGGSAGYCRKVRQFINNSSSGAVGEVGICRVGIIDRLGAGAVGDGKILHGGVMIGGDAFIGNIGNGACAEGGYAQQKVGYLVRGGLRNGRNSRNFGDGAIAFHNFLLFYFISRKNYTTMIYVCKEHIDLFLTNGNIYGIF